MADESASVGELSAREEPEVAGYRSLSALAVLGLLLGLASPAAFWHPVLLAVPLVGLLTSALALRRIALDPSAYSGRAAALVGLGLAVASATGAVVHLASFQWRFEQEARGVVEQWFRALADDAPYQAHQLTLPPEDRLPLDDNLPASYRADAALETAIRDYVREQPVRTLLALGPQAQVRFYQSETLGRSDGTALVYAVTFPRDGKTTTFFIQFSVVRVEQDKTGRASWRILRARGGYRPQGWPGSAG